MDKVNLNIEVDVEHIANELLTRELYNTSYQYGIKRDVEQAIKTQAVEQIKREITREADITSLITSSYGKDYLTKLAQETISAALKEKAEEYVNNWVKKNLQFSIESQLRKSFESILLPRLNQLVASLLVVNSETVDEQIADMEATMRDIEKGAYESGAQSGYEEAVKKL